MKPYFEEEVTKTVNNLKEENRNLCFALLSDSKLSDEGVFTRENIAEIDKDINFDFIVHCGNFILGNNPEKISRRLMKEEMQSYKEAVKSQKLFVCQGYSDGWRDERFKGQLACDIVCDQSWAKDTAFLNTYVTRNGNSPYYYSDFDDKKTRIVCLCSYVSDLDRENEMYEKYISLGVKQTVWLEKEALNLPEGWNVIIFSHRIPYSRFETGNDPFIYKGFSTEKTLAVLQQAKDKGINIVAWITGGYGADGYAEVGGINFVTMPAQSISSSPLNKCNLTELERKKDTLSQDCWDAVSLDAEKRQLKFLRFGAGEDKKIEY